MSYAPEFSFTVKVTNGGKAINIQYLTKGSLMDDKHKEMIEAIQSVYAGWQTKHKRVVVESELYDGAFGHECEPRTKKTI